MYYFYFADPMQKRFPDFSCFPHMNISTKYNLFRSFLPNLRDHHLATSEGLAWEKQSKDMRGMLKTWRSHPRLAFQQSILPRFLQWAQRMLPKVKQDVAVPLSAHLRGDAPLHVTDDDSSSQSKLLSKLEDVTPERRCGSCAARTSFSPHKATTHENTKIGICRR